MPQRRWYESVLGSRTPSPESRRAASQRCWTRREPTKAPYWLRPSSTKSTSMLACQAGRPLPRAGRTQPASIKKAVSAVREPQANRQPLTLLQHLSPSTHPSLTFITIISSRLAAFVLGALPLIAAATPLDTRTAGKCSTGPLQCCKSTQKANDPAISALLALIGVDAQDVDALVGLDCTPISVVGVGAGNSCNAQAVCCQDNNVGGVASIGCVPVSLSN